MDWLLVSFYQGSDDSTDPSTAVIQVYFNSRAICYETYCEPPVAFTQDSDDWNAFLEAIAQSILTCCGPTIDNPNYDPSLTSCWT